MQIKFYVNSNEIMIQCKFNSNSVLKLILIKFLNSSRFNSREEVMLF